MHCISRHIDNKDQSSYSLLLEVTFIPYSSIRFHQSHFTFKRIHHKYNRSDKMK